MLLRKNRGLREVPIDDSIWHNQSECYFGIPDTSPGPEISYLHHEDREFLTAAVERLRPTTRSVVEFHLRDLSARETAQRMGLSVTAVKARMFHGRKQVRKEFRHYMRPCAFDDDGKVRTNGQQTIGALEQNDHA